MERHDRLLGGYGARLLRPFAGGPPLSGELQAQGVEEERVDKAERMPQRARPRQPLGGGRGGRAGVAEEPQRHRERRPPGDARVLLVGAEEVLMPLRIEAADDLLEVLPRALEPSEEEQRPANQTVRDDDRVVVLLLGELQERLPQLERRLVPPGVELVGAQPVEDRQ